MSPEVLLLAVRLGLAAALYAFLTLVLVTLWRDFKAVAHGPAELPPSYLQIFEPPELSQGIQLAAINLVGRAGDNTIVLDEKTVSSHHARISFQHGQWWLEDLGSKNGTGVNDLDVEDPLVVTFGDRIRLGNVKMLLQSGSPPSQALAAPTESMDEKGPAEPPLASGGPPTEDAS